MDSPTSWPTCGPVESGALGAGPSVGRLQRRGDFVLGPDLVARPDHRLAQGIAPDLAAEDLGDLAQGRIEVVRMTTAAVSAQERCQAVAMHHPEGGNASGLGCMIHSVSFSPPDLCGAEHRDRDRPVTKFGRCD